MQPKNSSSSNYWYFGGNRLLLLTKSANMKGAKKFGQGPPPLLIWTKSKRTAVFSRETVPNRVLIKAWKYQTNLFCDLEM